MFTSNTRGFVFYIAGKVIKTQVILQYKKKQIKYLEHVFCDTFGHIAVFQTRPNFSIQFHTFDEYLLNSVTFAHIPFVFSHLITPVIHYFFLHKFR